jgi:hypothetical protein
MRKSEICFMGSIFALVIFLIFLSSRTIIKKPPVPTPDPTPTAVEVDKQAEYLKMYQEPCRDDEGEFIECKG